MNSKKILQNSFFKFKMARWFRYSRFRRKYSKRRYYRRRKGLRTTIARSKAMSKTNMIKVEASRSITLRNLANDQGGSANATSLAEFLKDAPAFINLGNIYDQFKVVSARFQIAVVNTTATGTMAACAAYDKTGFASGSTFANVTTYASYKVGKMVSPSIEAPSLVYYLPRDAVESATWFDTKKLNELKNTLVVGTTGYVTDKGGAENGTKIRICATMMLAVRGSRVDNSTITGI